MKSNDRQSAKEIFTKALDLPVEDRAAFLDDACKNSPGLRREVNDLLAKHQRLDGFLSEPLLFTNGVAALASGTIRKHSRRVLANS